MVGLKERVHAIFDLPLGMRFAIEVGWGVPVMSFYYSVVFYS